VSFDAVGADVLAAGLHGPQGGVVMRSCRRIVLSLAALLAALALSLPSALVVAAQEGTPESTCEQTTPEQSIELVQRWFGALSEGDSEAVDELASPDLVYHHPSPELPPITESAGSWASKRLQDYPDLTVTVEQIFATDDMVAAYVRYTGTHSGDTEEAQGVQATGQMIEWVGMVNFRVECGKFAEIWSVADDLGRLRRLGVITAEELASAEPVATPTP
jgi:steroid delta-isomerase-like uncharacterized protein